jgi:hypothetical protein
MDIKTELIQLIEQESDTHVLEAIRTLLKKTMLNSVLKEKLTARSLNSEKDIESGKVYNRDEAERILNERFNK